MNGDPLTAFLQSPSGATFQRLRTAVQASPDYDFHSSAIDEVIDLVAAENYSAVPDVVARLMPDWLLSPRLHWLAAAAGERRGAADAAQLEGALAEACMRGLLDSGDGSPQRPFLVTHITDEYDVLERLGREPVGQRSVLREGRRYDTLRCKDGSQLWFTDGPPNEEL